MAAQKKAPRQLRLPLRPGTPYQGVRAAKRAARRHTPGYRSEGIASGSLSSVASDARLGGPIAKHYEAARDESDSPEVQEAYRHFARETHQQFRFLTRPVHRGGAGIRVEVMGEDPYDSHAALVKDVKENRRLRVLSTRSTGSHPLLSDRENNEFRAVHDYFGHVATGRDFSRHGEEAAWQSHSQMYSPQARGAMTAETRGQNSALIYGRSGGFPEQKSLDMPSWAQQRSYKEAAAEAARSRSQSLSPQFEQMRLWE